MERIRRLETKVGEKGAVFVGACQPDFLGSASCDVSRLSSSGEGGKALPVCSRMISSASLSTRQPQTDAHVSGIVSATASSPNNRSV